MRRREIDLATIRRPGYDTYVQIYLVAWISAMKPVTLDRNCPICDGHGRVPEYHHRPRVKLCPLCDGMGKKLTEDGRAIIALVRATGIKGLSPNAEFGG